MATSDQTFSLAVLGLTGLVSQIVTAVSLAAPQVTIKWVAPTPKLHDMVAEEQVDLALLGADTALPEGLSERLLTLFERLVFARAGHPAIETWSKEA